MSKLDELLRLIPGLETEPIEAARSRSEGLEPSAIKTDKQLTAELYNSLERSLPTAITPVNVPADVGYNPLAGDDSDSDAALTRRACERLLLKEIERSRPVHIVDTPYRSWTRDQFGVLQWRCICGKGPTHKALWLSAPVQDYLIASRCECCLRSPLPPADLPPHTLACQRAAFEKGSFPQEFYLSEADISRIHNERLEQVRTRAIAVDLARQAPPAATPLPTDEQVAAKQVIANRKMIGNYVCRAAGCSYKSDNQYFDPSLTTRCPNDNQDLVFVKIDDQTAAVIYGAQDDK